MGGFAARLCGGGPSAAISPSSRGAETGGSPRKWFAKKQAVKEKDVSKTDEGWFVRAEDAEAARVIGRRVNNGTARDAFEIASTMDELEQLERKLETKRLHLHRAIMKDPMYAVDPAKILKVQSGNLARRRAGEKEGNDWRSRIGQTK